MALNAISNRLCLSDGGAKFGLIGLLRLGAETSCGLRGFPSKERKGANVAHERPTASDGQQGPGLPEPPRVVPRRPDGAAGLSRAQARALRRCTPLTSADLPPSHLRSPESGGAYGLNRTGR